MTARKRAGTPARIPTRWILLAVIVVALLVRTIDVLLVLFLAVILAVYFDAVSGFLQRRLASPQAWPSVAAVTLTLGALVGVVFLIAPAVASQVQDFITNLPKFLSELDQSINRLFRSIPVLRRGSPTPARPGLLATSLNEMFGFLRGALVPYLKGGVELIIEGVSVFVMALYMARHPGVYLDGVIALVPPARRPAGARHSLRPQGDSSGLGCGSAHRHGTACRAHHPGTLDPGDSLLPGVRRIRRHRRHRALLRNPAVHPGSGALRPGCLRPAQGAGGRRARASGSI